jgi:hypothetical protein
MAEKKIVKIVSILICVLLILQLSGCGYLLYPERRGQKSGQIDTGVAVLDGVGLLLFIIPGLIAFAVDFTSGAIYLPPGGPRRSSLPPEAEKTVVIQINPSHLNGEAIHEAVEKQAGVSIGMKKVEIYPLQRNENIGTLLSRLNRSGYRMD